MPMDVLPFVTDGGGALAKYRIIDFKREHRDVPGKIVTIEYDPNRNVRIGLVVLW